MRSLYDWVFTKFDKIVVVRKLQNTSSAYSTLTYIFISAMLIFSLVPFVFSFKFMTDWPPAAYSHPEVWNLTASKVQWKIKVGQSEICGERECAVNVDFDDSGFRSVVVPTRQFPLSEYKPGDFIFYRVKLNFPFHIMAAEEQILLHSLYVWASKYRLYLNGQLVDSGSSGAIQVAIPRDVIAAGEALLTMVVDPAGQTYQGIENMGDVVIGPKSIVKELDVITYDAEYVWPLWGILPPLVLCFIFCLFFLANRKSYESAVFSMFLASIVVYRFLFSYYSRDFKAWFVDLTGSRVSSIELGFVSSFVTTYLLAMFVMHYFRVIRQFSLARVLTGGLAVSAGGLLLFSFDSVDANTGKFLVRFLRFSVLLGSLILCYLTWAYLRARKISSHRTRATAMFMGMMIACITVYAFVLFRIQWMSLDVIGDRLYVSLLMFSLSFLTTLEYSHYLGQKDWLNSQFKSFLGENLAEELMNNPKAMDPKEVDVVVMFTDIRSFTSLSEKLPAAEIVNILNQYMEKMISVIGKHRGLIDKFAGDSIMASWGIPLTNKDDVINAVRCSLDIRAALIEFNKTCREKNWPELKTGIGLHYGRAVAGVIGSVDRKEYTLIGDTINTASRIEGETKKWECDVLLSDAIYERVKNEVLVIDCGDSHIRGKRAPVRLYQLLACKNQELVLDFHSEELAATFGDFTEPAALKSKQKPAASIHEIAG